MTTFYSDEIDSSLQTSLATTSIVNGYSSAGVASVAMNVGSESKATQTGSLTATVLTTILNITGTAGQLSFLAITSADATSRTLRVKVTVDGVSIWDFTSAAITTAGNGLPILGYYSAGIIGGGAAQMQAHNPTVKFRSSLKIEVASSLTESNKSTVYYKYNTEA